MLAGQNRNRLDAANDSVPADRAVIGRHDGRGASSAGQRSSMQ
jgi:hypothetical protein